MFNRIFAEKNKRITDDGKWLSVIDIISVVGGQANPNDTWQDIKKHKNCPTYETKKFPGKGNSKIICVQVEHVKELIKLFLPGARIPLIKKREVLQHFAMNEIDIHRTYIEEEVHEKILKALKMFHGIQQYSVLEYRVDLYFPKQNVVVECDENGHAKYLQEEIREKKITEMLGNEWVRYNPNDKDFDLFILINQILEKLVK